MALLDLWVESGETLSVRHVSVAEKMSTPFSIAVEVVHGRPDVDTTAIVGRAAAFRLHGDLSAAGVRAQRRWTGVCREMELVKAVAPGKGDSTYRLSLVPVFWLLSQRKNLRIFQHRTAPEIAAQILGEWRIETVWRIDSRHYPKLEYRVQYGETDLDFVGRMLEEVGISYFFVEDERRGSVLVLSDTPEGAESRGSIAYEDEPTRIGGREVITTARFTHDVRPGAYTVRDYDFRRPAFPLLGSVRGAPAPEAHYEIYEYQPGGFLVEKDERSQTPSADDRGVARHDQTAGSQLAQRRLEGERASQKRVVVETNAMDLAPGTVFSIAGHPTDTLEEKRLLSVEFSMEGGPLVEWKTSAVALFADKPYRPPLRTPKPRINGVQSATVVGPKGHEIHTDEFGRVRVQFPWDREGQFDDGSSCWMRVSHGSAGGSFGMVVMPRVGQEVLVGFLEGDPDQPLVVGRVFNATSPVPYKLPEQKTMTGLKGASSPAGTAGFNEIRFDDATGTERFSVRAEKDLEKLVQNDETETTGGNRQVEVKKDLMKTVEGLEKEFTKGKRMLGVVKDMCKLVGGNEGEATTGDRKMQVGRDLTLDIMGGYEIKTIKEHTTTVGGRKLSIVFGAEDRSFAPRIELGAGSPQDWFTAQVILEPNKVTLQNKDGSQVILDGPNVQILAPNGAVSIYGKQVFLTADEKVTIHAGTELEAGSAGHTQIWGDPIDLNK